MAGVHLVNGEFLFASGLLRVVIRGGAEGDGHHVFIHEREEMGGDAVE